MKVSKLFQTFRKHPSAHIFESLVFWEKLTMFQT